jgi:hypothetical protein
MAYPLEDRRRTGLNRGSGSQKREKRVACDLVEAPQPPHVVSGEAQTGEKRVSGLSAVGTRTPPGRAEGGRASQRACSRHDARRGRARQPAWPVSHRQSS